MIGIARHAKALAVILLLVLFHGVNNYLILQRSELRIGVDSGIYYETASDLARSLKAGGIAEAARVLYAGLKPPLYFVASAPLLALTQDHRMLSLVNLLFLALLLVAVYAAGRRLYGEEAGLLAAFLTGMFPSVFALSRVFQIDLALTAIVAATFALMVLDRFDRFPFALLTGAVMGLGLLTKQPYALFILPMVLYFFMKDENIRESRRILYLCAALAVAALVALPWYARHDRLSWATYEYFMFSCGDVSDPLYFVKRLFFNQLFPAYFCLLAASFLFFFRRRDFFLPGIVTVLLVVFSVFTNKVERFILPVMPFMALMIAAWAAAQKPVVRRLLVVLSVAQFFVLSYGFGFLLAGNATVRRYFGYPYPPNGGLFCRMIDKGNWRAATEKTLELVRENAGGRAANLLVISDDVGEQPELRYRALRRGIPLFTESPRLDVDVASIGDGDLAGLCDKRVAGADFVLADAPGTPRLRLRYYRQLMTAFRQVEGGFTSIGRLSFQNGKEMVLYRRIPRPVKA